MKKLINKPEDFARETVEGIVLAHPESLKMLDNSYHCLVRADEKKAGKVAIATGGGSGHLPVFLGYVGFGLADGVTVGNVFASPSAEAMHEVDKAIHAGAGVLHLYGRYGGDIMNFGMARDLDEMEGIEVTEVLVSDDIASAPRGKEDKRRGVAGLVFAYKIAGAAAENMLSLAEVTRIAQKTVDNTRTLGVALTPCIVPEAGKATFSIGEDEMEIGMGIHGEPGIERSKLNPVDEVVTNMINRLVEDLPYQAGDRVAILVNGLGGTPREELYLAYRKAHSLLQDKGISIHRKYIGEYATSLEMAGMSISLLKLDDELRELLDAPCYSPFFAQFR
ncbi:dihydroxyacetone kinase subunit DhaK [Propionispora vibrioides]|uniref:Dihydroxyacetone kinase, N-terminal domain n=1 Tax=Propionispora vibrioides TaxID=112903 RepID=A0A1H8Y3J2_9FIRM|nr:dihydroxyacetone kinase subunit DhaK [Propionispora vibrioides]SEP46669.1 dihydroxyacetone kinase, N-terminal domain [Propionispora vibrioides]